MSRKKINGGLAYWSLRPSSLAVKKFQSVVYTVKIQER